MSKMIKRYDASAGREYTHKGETKTHWVYCGSATAWDDGSISLRLDAVPTFPGWNGKIQLFPERDNP